MHRRMKNPFRPGSQKYRILERLREGPATNAELVKYALNYTARISEIRAKISEQGLASWRSRSAAAVPSTGSTISIAQSKPRSFNRRNHAGEFHRP